MNDAPTVLAPRSIFQSPMARFVLLGAIVFVSAAAGSYLGFALGLRAKRSAPHSFPNHSYFDLGQRFPNYDLRDTKSHMPVTLMNATQGRRALLLFLSPTCGACDALIGYWKRRVLPKLDSDIKVICIYDSAELSDATSLDSSAVLSEAAVMTTDRHSQWTVDGISATPTLVGLDRHSVIQFIISGFDARADAEFINEHL